MRLRVTQHLEKEILTFNPGIFQDNEDLDLLIKFDVQATLNSSLT